MKVKAKPELRKARLHNNWSLEEVAKKISDKKKKYSRQVINNHESGRTGIKEHARDQYMLLYGVAWDDLFEIV